MESSVRTTPFFKFISGVNKMHIHVLVLVMLQIFNCFSPVLFCQGKGGKGGKGDKYDQGEFFKSTAKADVKVKEMNYAVEKKILLVKTNTKILNKDKPHYITRGLLDLREEFNSQLSGKTVHWNVNLAKSVIDGEKRADIIIPAWIENSTGKLLTLSGNDVSKCYVISVIFEGKWIKELKKGDTVLLNAVIKNVSVSTSGVTVGLTGAILKPVANK